MENDVLQSVPLAPIQKRIWITQEHSSYYYQWCLVEVRANFDMKKLETCIQQTVSKHEILRTSFEHRKGLALPIPVIHQDNSKIKIDHLQDIDFDESQNLVVLGDLQELGSKGLKVTAVTRDTQSFYLKIGLPSLAADAYTIQYLAAEICWSYCNDLITFDTPDLVEYSQFAAWQKELMSSPDKEIKDFWTQYDFQQGNQSTLAFAKQKKDASTFKPGLLEFELNEMQVEQLLALPAHYKVEHNLFATFALVLNRLLGEEKLTVGFDFGTREYRELEHTLGAVNKMLPAILKVDSKEIFNDLVIRLARETSHVTDRGDYFEWPEESDPAYFRWLFQYLKAPEVAHQNQNFEIKKVASIFERSDLNLQIQKYGKGFLLQFVFDTEKFSGQDIEEIKHQFLNLLNQTLMKPDSTIEELYQGANSQLVDKVHLVGKEERSLMDMFEDVVLQNADEIAVSEKDQWLSYQELDERSDRLAAYLMTNRKISPEQIVAVGMSRSMHLMVTLLGILKSGATYLPIDSKTPKRRIELILEDSRAVVFIGESELSDGIEACPAIVADAEFWKEIDDTKFAPLPTVKPDHAAYVIYTSGSTGKPKGVVIPHGALVNYISWFINKYKISNADRTLLFSSIAFDLSYTGLWSCLMSGACLVIHEESEYLDPITFTKDLIDHEITYIKLTPSHFSLITRDPDFKKRCAKYQLRLIVLGGESIVPSDVVQYLDHKPDTKFINHYGPTESTIGVLTYDIDKENISEYAQKPVLGFPIAHTEVCILDENRQPVVKGQMGEIYLSGRGLATGYLNNENLTAEKFATHSIAPDIRMYQSGDLGIMLSNGTILFKGRKDFQVKIRGYRIEIGEIEHLILALKSVENVTVQVSSEKDTHLIAFVVGNKEFDKDQLESYLAEQLPHYMIPSQVIEVASIPLLPNGKVDAKQLMNEVGKGLTQLFQAATNATEQILVEIWQEILVRDKVGIHDNFFTLGGHSLKAAQMVTRVYKTCQKKLELKSIFDKPTISQLAKILEQGATELYQCISPIPEKDYYELSHAQKRLWILDHFQKEKVPYTSPFYFKIKGGLDQNILAEALDAMLLRHEALRTTFEVVNDAPMQKIHTVNSCGFKLEIVDMTSAINPAEHALKRAAAESEHEFNLEKGPLFLAKLFLISPTEYLLAFNIHHIISDGWSLRILFEEVLTLYEEIKSNRPSSLKPLKVQYKDYAAWHNGAISKKEEQYWMQKLANHPDLINLPYDVVEEPETQTYIRQNVVFSEEETAQIKAIAKRLNTTTSNFMLSIYAVFINQVAGHNDFLIGVGHANRNHEDTEGLIGFFINMLAIRIQISDDDSLPDIISKASASAVEALENSNYPFDLIIEKLCKKRQADRQPILNVMYDFKNFYDVTIDSEPQHNVADLEIEMIKTGAYIAAHDLILHVVENDTNITYDFEYKQECFLPETAQNFYRVFNHLAKLVITEMANKN